MGRRAAESAEQRGGVEGARTRKAGRRKADPRPSHETATRTKPSSLCALCASAANLSGATGETRWGHTNSPRYSSDLDPRPSHETATRTKPSSLCALCASAANLSGATGETRWGHTNSPRYSCVLRSEEHTSELQSLRQLV